MSTNTPAFDLSLLDGFTDPDTHRYALSRPWRMADGRAVATDGRIIVVLDDGSAVDPPDGRVPNDDGIARVLDGFDRDAEYFLIPRVQGPRHGADPWWHTGQPCVTCNSKGVITCDHCLHEDQCIQCDGTGRANGTHYSRETVDIDGMIFDRRYVWLIRQLPGAMYRPFGGDRQSLDFIFDGGIGRLCGCEADDE